MSFKYYNEYMPSLNSMAAQLFDIKGRIKERYVKFKKQNSHEYPYKVIKLEKDCFNLEELLTLYSKEELKTIIEYLEVDILKNSKKSMLVSELSNEIIKKFKLFLELINEDMYYFIESLQGLQKIPSNKINNQNSFINYLIERGLLFCCFIGNEEVFVMPKELQDIFKNVDYYKFKKTTKLNTCICKMGRGILYYYGVVDEYDFNKLYKIMINNYKEGFLDKKVSFPHIRDIDSLNGKDTERIDEIFKNYACYDSQVEIVQFDDDFYRFYYADHSVAYPYNTYIKQNNMKDIEFVELSCNDLLKGQMTDSCAKKKMSQYLSNNFNVSLLEAELIVDEWSWYEKNDMDFRIYVDLILEQLNCADVAEINTMLSFCFSNFMNDIIKWRLKGHTLKQLTQKERGEFQESVNPNPEGKTGRNAPCPCGSGKKYKKCCGK
ncbi:SEC-C metal-binding domain-containing protein [Herbivorax sp. ANBcel31]|uniref:YecA family protein n=1 Tax=Herbivorax sp. ANBcel31 TaxID=3069754 RepID=UPI0027AEE6F6|nr:SEC-C metal-binding domain-containing protein [Herbivorax sp. ANBcel31]MDQ2085079.1 SEC-C metal-binding domain-containing protein [Herbivorax sp. ANBcel31]